MAKDIDVHMDSRGRVFNRLGFGRMNAVQKFVDSEAARLMEDLVPYDLGTLVGSAKQSVLGSGRIIYNTPYARKQFYEGRKVSGYGKGRLWSFRMQRLRGAQLTREVQAFVEKYT